MLTFNQLMEYVTKNNLRSEIYSNINSRVTYFGFSKTSWVWHWFTINAFLYENQPMEETNFHFFESYSMNTGKSKKGIIRGINLSIGIENQIGKSKSSQP